ncbi:MAG: hypothetical protein JST70_09465 [Bacteroidetes bacterium]|nr:hypothetical protein [Bacteroidota bacterium]
MKLYKKQLNSIEELKKEKRRLKAKLDETQLFSAPESITKETATGSPDLLGALTEMISSPSAAGTIGSLAMPLLSMAGKKISKKYLLRFAKEFIGGYAKWKAVEIGYKAARSYIKSRKRKKAEKKAAEA